MGRMRNTEVHPPMPNARSDLQRPAPTGARELLAFVHGLSLNDLPADVVDRWSDNVRSAVSEGRLAMRTREVELKSSFDRVAGH